MQQTKTTTHLRLPDPRQLSVPAPITMAICVVALAGIIAAIGRIQSAGSAAAVPTAAIPAPIIIIASPVAQIPPTAIPAALVAHKAPAQRWVTAWAAPDSNVVLGPIPAPDASAIVARYGDEWYMIQWNGGPAWIRAADLGLHIANLAPPNIVYVSAPEAPRQAIAPEPQYQAAESAPTPAAAMYEVLTERQRNIQGRMVQPTYPTLQPMQVNDVNAEWARQQQRQQGDLP